MKKCILWIAVILAAVLCLFPIRQWIKDGGSVAWQPILPAYRVVCWNGFGEVPESRTAGVTVRIFGITVYDGFHEESME